MTRSKNDNGITDALLILAIYRQIPRRKFVTTAQIQQSLDAEGISVNTRRLQRLLANMRQCEAFRLETQPDGRAFCYRTKAPVVNLRQPDLSAKVSLLVRLCEEHLRYQLPSSIVNSLKSLYEKARTTLNEPLGNAKAKSWLAKVAVVPETVPMLAPVIKSDVFEVVSEALYRDEQLKVHYRDRTGKVTDKTVSPLGLVQQGQRLYLVCRYDTGEVRHLALHRMISVTAVNEAAVRDPRFSLKQYVHSRHFNYSNGERIQLTVRTDNEVLATNLTETPFNKTQNLVKTIGGDWTLSAEVDDTVLIDGWLAVWEKSSREAGKHFSYEKRILQ